PQGISELKTLLVAQLLEARLCWTECGVGLARTLVVRGPCAKQRRHRCRDLFGSQHIKVVEPSPSVPENVGIGRWCHSAPVELLEGLDDRVRLVAEVKNEGALLQRMD